MRSISEAVGDNIAYIRLVNTLQRGPVITFSAAKR